MESNKNTLEENNILELSQAILEDNPSVETLKSLSKILENQINSDSPKYSALKNIIKDQIDIYQNPLIDKTNIDDDNSVYSINKYGQKFLEPIVTSSDEDVYAFKDGMNATTIAAAMARLSRRGDDLRITLLDEFSDPNTQKDEKLLRRVITAYGDDSVQQLTGQHFVIENASNLLTKKIEWGRLASYLEQSTRYIYFDAKDINNNYKYVIPPEIKDDLEITEYYNNSMNQIFDNYKFIVHSLTEYVRQNIEAPNMNNKQDRIAWLNATRAQACDAARGVLPVAIKSTVGVFASAQATENMIMRLRGDQLLEARQTGDAILRTTRVNLGVFLERADDPQKGGAYSGYLANIDKDMKQLALEHDLSSHYNLNSQGELSADLINYNYPNELNLVADMLYEYSHHSLNDLREVVASWDEAEKIKVFNAYIGQRLNRRQKPKRALEKIHYEWDILSDYGIFRDIQRHRMVEDLNWQDLSNFHGYDIPDLIKQANLENLYNQTFEISDSLYEFLNVKTGHKVAQYATLLGNYMRWKISYNGRQAFHIHELRTSPQGHPNYRKLVNMMHQEISNIHPHLSQAMIFVNKGEDPALTRLAAEKYQQYKLGKLV